MQIWRRDDEVAFRALTPAAFALRSALARQERLATAAAAALAAEPGADLASLVREALEEGCLTA